MKRILVLAGLALALMGLGAPMAAADVVKTELFSIDLPSGWVAIPRAELDEKFKEALANMKAKSPASGQKLSQATTYEYGFQPVTHQRWFESPYMLVDGTLQGSGLPGDMAAENRAATDWVVGLAKDLTGQPPFVLFDDYDAAKRIHTVELKVYGEKDKPNTVVSCATVYTAKGWFSFYWYASEADYGRVVDQMRRALSSIELAPGLK
jgi:hypothetical protein